MGTELACPRLSPITREHTMSGADGGCTEASSSTITPVLAPSWHHQVSQECWRQPCPMPAVVPSPAVIAAPRATAALMNK